VSAVLQRGHRLRPAQAPDQGMAAICRARRIVREFGGSLPLESRVGCGHEVVAREAIPAAARHLRFPSDADALSELAISAHVRVKDLETGLARLADYHDFDSCPGGEECPFAGFVPFQLTHF
jgi:hypothetical protein